MLPVISGRARNLWQALKVAEISPSAGRRNDVIVKEWGKPENLADPVGKQVAPGICR